MGTKCTDLTRRFKGRARGGSDKVDHFKGEVFTSE